MSANVGDRIRLHSNTTGTPDRVGTIVAVIGSDGGPPYRVRFESGDESTVVPGPDALIEPPSAGERLEQVAERAGEVATEAAQAAKDTAETVTGNVARAVSSVADDVAKRLGR